MSFPVEPESDNPRATGIALTSMVLEIFRLNSALVSTGDALVSDLGLTSARWQVLGAVTRSPVPVPVAHLARAMGFTRQAVQRVVDDLRVAGMVRLEPNPHHRRAMLVLMTDAGADAYAQAAERQERWVNNLAAGLPADVIATTTDLLQTLRHRLAPPDASASD